MKKTKKFDRLERDEATEYFLHRFSSRDVTISKSGPFIRVGVGGVDGPEFVVTREPHVVHGVAVDSRKPDGWLVWRNEKDFQKILASPARSYEQAAIAIEKDMGW